ncbi:hypothetical protein KFE98_16125 [bacterium SCSIO 12741]|nr:hypothetical protein KFE98_16125 [bacterium SCSIO 12741]
MKTNFLFLLLMSMLFYSCNNNAEATKLQEKAIEVYFDRNLDSSTRIDSSLTLTDQALALNPQNLQALIHRDRLMFVMKDAEGMMKSADRLIELYPDRPFFRVQKAFYLELTDRPTEAKNLYQEALSMFEEDLREDSTQFDLYIGYLGSLEYAGDSAKAMQVYKQLNARSWTDFQEEILKLYHKERLPKKRLVDYWEGRITYDEI